MFKRIEHIPNGTIKDFIPGLNQYFSNISHDEDCYQIIGESNTLVRYETSLDTVGVCIASKFLLPVEIIKNYPDKFTLRYFVSGEYSKPAYTLIWKDEEYPCIQLLKTLKHNKVEINNQNLFIQAATLLFQYIRDICPTRIIGWQKLNEELEYIGITKPSYNLKLREPKPYTKNNHIKSYRDSLNLLAFQNNDITYPLFANVLLSFASILIKKKHKKGKPLLINLHGIPNEICSVWSLANIFLNLYAHPNMSLNSLPANSCKVSINSSRSQINKALSVFKDCPMLIVNARDSSSSSSNVEYILEATQKRQLSVFPIFVTQKQIHNEDNFYCLDLEAYQSNATISDLEQARNTIPRWHFILNEFVGYIIKLYNGRAISDDIIDFKKSLTIYKSCQRKTTPELDMRAEDLVEPCVNLNFAFHIFIEFGLDNNWISDTDADELKHRATTIFKKMATLPDENLPEYLLGEETYKAFCEYLRSIFVDKYAPDFDYWANLSCDGDIEPCFYLEYDKYFEDFCKQKNNQTNISIKAKKDFEKRLSAKGWIKPYKSQGKILTLYQSRTNPKTKEDEKGKAKSVKSLIVFQDQICIYPPICDIS